MADPHNDEWYSDRNVRRAIIAAGLWLVVAAILLVAAVVI